MGLRLCIECGARPPRAGRVPCRACGGAPPAWRRVPITLLGLARRLAVGAVLTGSAAACVLAIFVLCTGWAHAWWPLRVLQVLLAALMLVFGGLASCVMLRAAFEQLVAREHVHDQPGRPGSAHTVLGRLVKGRGHGTRDGGALAPGTPEVTALPVFADIRAIGGHVGSALGGAQPKAVDLAIAAALLGLASRGRCELLVRTTRSWYKGEAPAPLTRVPDQHTVLVRRLASGRALPLEAGWLEGALLAALDALGGTHAARAPQPSPRGPYRQGLVVPAPTFTGEEPILVETLMGALTGGRRKARGWLRAILRDEARRARREGDLDARATSTVGPALAAVFKAPPRRFGTSPAAALLVQITHGISNAGRPFAGGPPGGLAP